MPAEAWTLGLGAVAAAMVGFSKTGVPGTGILVIPLMAALFGGRLSVGATLPLLILGDVLAVALYRQHAQWARLRTLAPWLLLGLLLGSGLLKLLGDLRLKADPLSPMIGVLVLVMLALNLLRGRLGQRLVPHSREGTVVTGALAGFTTMVSNAAGPIMSIFLNSSGLPKDQLMGTTAWTFLLLNLAKVPFLALLTADNPQEPLYTLATLRFDLLMVPLVLAGAWAGRALQRRLPEQAFSGALLSLAAVSAVLLIVRH
ncbi:sulfite exporter TauE/SafE family protein [Deinococcus sonorensis]|uniref:Probable membrane transporter protein n=1 Tax=Deinococcus sonorensis KR-87 TaxID=694439 RepID=A0AAU7UGU9_9DEIO